MRPDFQTGFAADKWFFAKSHNYISVKLLMKTYESLPKCFITIIKELRLFRQRLSQVCKTLKLIMLRSLYKFNG